MRGLSALQVKHQMFLQNRKGQFERCFVLCELVGLLKSGVMLDLSSLLLYSLLHLMLNSVSVNDGRKFVCRGLHSTGFELASGLFVTNQCFDHLQITDSADSL